MSDEFTIIRPIVITDAILTSSSVAEPSGSDPAAWNAANNYTTGTQVSRSTTHKIYQRIAPGGVDVTLPENDSTKWLEVGYVNRWKMFDAANESQTQNANSIVIVLTPGAMADYIAFENVEADSIRVQVGTTYDQTIQMRTRIVEDWWDYFFEVFRLRRSVMFTGLPPLTTNVVTITITRTGGTAKIGTCVPGLSKAIGGTKYGAKAGIIDYSIKDTDAFGNTTVVKRPYKKRIDCTFYVSKELVDEVHELLSEYRATPIFWAAAGNMYTSLIGYGFYRDFDIEIEYFDTSLCSIQIETLT